MRFLSKKELNFSGLTKLLSFLFSGALLKYVNPQSILFSDVNPYLCKQQNAKLPYRRLIRHVILSYCIKIMKISFEKYHGAGNDFIIIDNRSRNITLNGEQIRNLCHRHYGIGGDGLIELCSEESADFYMHYYNADGNEGTMCGNGGRCIAAFALQNNIAGKEQVFKASDGYHRARIIDTGYPMNIRLEMNDVDEITEGDDHYFIDTGSPHYVKFQEKIDEVSFLHEAKTIRHHYREGGTNVNFAVLHPDNIALRTFERGVENETLACGTGITATALAAAWRDNMQEGSINVKALGGVLKVHFTREKGAFRNIWLEGPAVFVFKGEFQI